MNDKQTVAQFIQENAFKLAAIIVAILNIWLVTKLTPLYEDIAITNQRVSALENATPVTTREFDEIIDRLDRIESKLDAHLLK